jgi:DNA repair exonuclease SbcCD nuclease subunit
MDRARDDRVDFVLHAGDFSNDYQGSPELVKKYLNNEYDLSVYGVYGNHELESNDNSMELVTPLLTNDTRVIWGTADGKLGDGSIGYYYFEKKG